MPNSVSFKGIHSSSFGLTAFSENREMLSRTKDDYRDAPLRPGSYLFADQPGDKEISVLFSFIGVDYTEKRARARQIAAWLRSTRRERLIFDDEPELFYLAKVSNEVRLEHLQKAGQFMVTFRCYPYALSVTEHIFTETLTEIDVSEEITVGGTAETEPVINLTNTGAGTIGGFTIQILREVD